MNCFYCGALISNGAINSARRRARVSQCPRFSCRWRCGQCKQTFNYECLYKSLLKHRELFKNTLIEINPHTFPTPILQIQFETFTQTPYTMPYSGSQMATPQSSYLLIGV